MTPCAASLSLGTVACLSYVVDSNFIQGVDCAAHDTMPRASRPVMARTSRDHARPAQIRPAY
ncbi:hypothetical protein; putative exported protein [Cupriavidus metallidurans CH34]|uniref:Uncharacterized protein n=1 Tax=Cupriavidus metallidurans (strain ATCC 43123 / DSM 2839 / NBRC 102507 / CH34) TaxID=266264 RepID=D3DXV4_CUPMC|nr:hypothetical protein; putative exported protein [Cupriavidus metallidurans CH34]